MSGVMSQESVKSHRTNGVVTNQKMHPVTREVPNEAIARRAYEKFEARGGIHGGDREDWAQAQSELLAEAKDI